MSAHALDVANLLAISHTLDVSKVVRDRQATFFFFGIIHLALTCKSKSSSGFGKSGIQRVTVVQRRKTLRVYETRLSGTTLMPA